MNRGCKVESYSNKYFPNTSLTKTCQPLYLDDNKMPTMDHSKYFLFFAICGEMTEIAEIAVFDLINLAKPAISPIFHHFWRNRRNCKNRRFCWAPFFLY